jgi:hypothetical protein
LPLLPILGGKRVLYVIAIGADYSARSKVVATLAEHLDKYRLRDSPWIFAEPAWSVEDYLKQCIAYPQSTEGAIMLSVAGTATGSQNNFFYTKNWFALDSDAAEAVVASLLERMNCAPSQGSSNVANGSPTRAPFCSAP